LYSNKLLEFEFENYSGAFDENGNTKIKLSNVKATCKVSYMGNTGGFQAEATIYGLGIELISALSAKGIGPYTNQLSQIGMTITADGTMVFSGDIYSCYANMNAIPDTAIILSAVAGNSMARTVAAPFTFKGKQQYKDVIESICKANGYTLRAVGIDGKFSNNISLAGSPLAQVKAACNEAGFQLAINGKEVTVWQPGVTIYDDYPVVSAEHGLIGYPVFTQSGITFQTQFSTYISQGRNVKLITDLPHASGICYIFAVDHYLSSWMKNGPWLSVAQAVVRQDVKQ